MTYVLAASIVLAVNLLSAFGPPTWSVLVLFRLRSHLSPVALVIEGALAAGLGRFLLAEACRPLRGRLSAKHTTNLAVAKQRLSSRRGSLFGLALFAISPIPSAQLFEAASLIDVALVPLVLIFFARRLVSYAFHVGGASAVKHTDFGRLISSSLTSPARCRHPGGPTCRGGGPRPGGLGEATRPSWTGLNPGPRQRLSGDWTCEDEAGGPVLLPAEALLLAP